MLKFTGFDQCIIGTACVWHPDGTRIDRLVYDGDMIMAQLMHQDGMEYEEAQEHIAFIMEGGYVGPQTPIVIWPWNEDDADL